MPTLHDTTHRSEIVKRVQALGPRSERRWGKMSVDQMLWHVNQALASAIGDIQAPQEKPPLPRPLMKFFVLNVPWPKGAPTVRAFVPSTNYDFNTEHARCLRLIDALAARKIDRKWPEHPILGRMSGQDYSRLQAKHLNHHLTQFGV